MCITQRLREPLLGNNVHDATCVRDGTRKHCVYTVFLSTLCLYSLSLDTVCTQSLSQHCVYTVSLSLAMRYTASQERERERERERDSINNTLPPSPLAPEGSRTAKTARRKQQGPPGTGQHSPFSQSRAPRLPPPYTTPLARWPARPFESALPRTRARAGRWRPG